MISVDDFLAAVEEITREEPTYRTGGTGADGTCDCVGLIMGAMYRCGHGKYAMHGSNWFARNQTVELGHVEAHTKGMIVFKAKENGQDGYDLPERYQAGGANYNGDLLDYYHVGVVTSVQPLVITHCTSSGGVNGMKRDTTEREYRNWKWGGFVKDVDYEGNDGGGDEGVNERAVSERTMIEMTGRVHSLDGNPVKMRRDPSTKNPYIAKVPDGAEITVYEQAGDWSTVGWNGMRGYMMSEFIALDESSELNESNDESGESPSCSDLDSLLADHAVMLESMQEQREMLKLICEKLGIAVDGVAVEENVDEEVNG